MASLPPGAQLTGPVAIAAALLASLLFPIAAPVSQAQESLGAQPLPTRIQIEAYPESAHRGFSFEVRGRVTVDVSKVKGLPAEAQTPLPAPHARVSFYIRTHAAPFGWFLQVGEAETGDGGVFRARISIPHTVKGRGGEVPFPLGLHSLLAQVKASGAYFPSWSNAVPLEVRSGVAIHLDEVALTGSIAAVSGRLVDDAGVPVADTLVTVSIEKLPLPSVRTAADGSFAVKAELSQPLTPPVELVVQSQRRPFLEASTLQISLTRIGGPDATSAEPSTLPLNPLPLTAGLGVGFASGLLAFYLYRKLPARGPQHPDSEAHAGRIPKHPRPLSPEATPPQKPDEALALGALDPKEAVKKAYAQTLSSLAFSGSADVYRLTPRQLLATIQRENPALAGPIRILVSVVERGLYSGRPVPEAESAAAVEAAREAVRTLAGGEQKRRAPQTEG